ncbi:MAG: methyltransferase domain-containing protein [Myxococcota bacterium]|jgi:2-polyprenyl-3-methyl-5-hydroxy-6-metoxy-1,4-benzoquinol methylase|nr:methyltransferase domain-containing protein [Myxococcota bacterium]
MADKLDEDAVPEYFSNPGTVERWWSPHQGPLAFHYDAELRILDDHLAVSPALRVIDVGTGRGRFGLHMAKQGCEVLAVDISREMLEVAREASKEAGVADKMRFREGSADALEVLDEGEFDLVLCMELFDHLPDLEGALASMRSLLSPGGQFVFTYVASESAYGILGNAYRWLRRRLNAQGIMISRTYSLPEIRRSLAAQGFELDEYFGVGVLCLNAQTRLFQDGWLSRSTLALARAEARRWPYHRRSPWARMGAHVVGIARAGGASSPASGGES